MIVGCCCCLFFSFPFSIFFCLSVVEPVWDRFSSLPLTSLQHSLTSSQFMFCLHQRHTAVCQTWARLLSIFTQAGDPFIDAMRDNESKKKGEVSKERYSSGVFILPLQIKVKNLYIALKYDTIMRGDDCESSAVHKLTQKHHVP